jgi:ribulose 1,5-bisphosphate synthetase/thiazole synthase
MPSIHGPELLTVELLFEEIILMDYYKESKRGVPIIKDVDVLVLGAGPAGFSTAVNAARAGAKVLLIEMSGTVGGQATAGIINHWIGASEGPFLEEVLTKAQDTDEDFNHYEDEWLYARQIINPSKLAIVMVELLHEAGVELMLYTYAVAPMLNENSVYGVITESKSGRTAITAKVIVDATGDGDIAAKAGATYTKGRESDGKMQPGTLMFKVAGVNPDKAIYPGNFEENIRCGNEGVQDLGKKYLEYPMGHVLLHPTSIPGVVTANMTNCPGIDGTKTEEITRGQVTCTLQIPKIIDFLRNYVPGYENCYLHSIGSLMGIRETRHFHGLSTINENDILNARVFDDWIATRCYFNFDVHNLDGPGLDPTGVQQGFAQKAKYTIPYGCFVPEAIDGLLLCGRNISGTHLAHSNFRVMAICVNMGQGVGTAAALCATRDILPRDLDIKALQKRLREQGVRP